MARCRALCAALVAASLATCSALRLSGGAPQLSRAARRHASLVAPRHLFGGAPPEEESKPAAAPGGGSGMSVPGMGEISEDEMKLAMEFREKMSAKMKSVIVEGSGLGGKVKVTYDGQGQPIGVEISPEAVSEGEAAVSAAVTEAAQKAQADALGKMKSIMMEMQKDIAKTLGEGK